jgi:hypothetical protein
MSLSAQIKFPRVLQFSTEDEIYLTRSGTGAPDNTVSQVFYMGAVDTSLQVLSGYTAGLTAQGCNINPAGTAFEADGSWFNIANLSSSYTEITDKAVRFIRIKGASDLGADFKCYVYNSICNMIVS